MKTFIVCLTLSLFAAVASLQAGDDKAPATKPAAVAADKAKTAPVAAAATSSSDCCCGSDAVCKLPIRKVAMSPKAAALLPNK